MKQTNANIAHPSGHAKKTISKTAHREPAGDAGGGQVRIRMYRVGFGDFFLLTVPSDAGPQHVLIDCGVTKGTSGKGDIGTIKTAVADMRNETGGELALIIMTHRHMDHIIGFSRCPEFKEFKGKVGAIWMPVWENEYDAGVSKFQEDLTALALDVQNHLAAAADGSPGRTEMLAMLQNATGAELGLTGTGGGSNAASLDLLKHGLGVQPSYYSKGNQAKLPQVLVDAGLQAEILGPPPAEETAFMKLMDLKKQVGQYLDSAAASLSHPERFRPFRQGYTFEPEGWPSVSLQEWWQHDPAPDHKPWKKIEKLVDEAQPTALIAAVKQLDNFLNNQSLVVLFTFREKKLLFAGDAQGGNWEYWLYNGDAPTQTPSANLGPLGEEVLGHLDFYKVGHHGSTNATPIAAVNAMNKGFVAMCSTQPDCFGSTANGAEVPRAPLMEALAAKACLVRSDEIAVKAGDADVVATAGSPKSLSQPKSGSFVVGPCYVDYLF